MKCDTKKSLCRGLIFGLLLLISIAAGTISAQTTDTAPWLILYAFTEEGQVIGSHMEVERTDTLLGREVLVGTIGDKRIALAETGVGMTNAAMTTQRMIDRYHPMVILFTGIAGAIDTSVHIGDIVVPQDWITHDYGYYGADGFKTNSPSVFLPEADSIARVQAFSADLALIQTTAGLAQNFPGLEPINGRTPRVIVGGTGVSGNSFIDSREKRDWLSSEFHALVTDMESAAVGQVCTVNNLPFIIFRSASDLAGGSGSETAHKELDQFFKVAAVNSSTVVIALLNHLAE